jgi:hypothetical protein
MSKDKLEALCARRTVLMAEEERAGGGGETSENRAELQGIRADLGRVLHEIALLEGA